MNFKPVNRHLLIEPIDLEEAEESQVLLPEGWAPAEERFRLYRVLKISNDCTKEIKESTLVAVEASMVEEIKILNKSFCLVLENYIVGIIDGIEN